ncbi:MAG TPA: hypothetical protein VF488_05735, partial [Gemmatimonadaceae bacterium]
MPTASGGNATDDVDRPTISFSLNSGNNNVVDIGANLAVTVTSTDNFGVGYVFTRVSDGASVIGVDTATIKPTQKSVTRVVQIPLGAAAKGDQIVVRATAADGATNEKTDSLVITIADTSGPSLIVSTSKANRPVQGGDTLDVRITANDSSGIAYAGYRLFRVRTTDSVLVRAESTVVAAGARVGVFQTPVYNWVIPDTLLTGNYAIVPFALDRSGVYTKAGKPGASFNLVDGALPVLTFLGPIPGAKLNVGDSLLVTAHLTDNIALQKVSFIGISTRTPSAGIDQQIIRYPQVTAPTTTFRAGLRDTLIQRYIRVQAPVDTVTDTLVVTGVVSDLANNVDTVRVKVKMVNGPTVTFLSPLLGDSATNGANLAVAVRGTSILGVSKLGFRVQSAPGWPTPIDTTVVVNYASALKTTTVQANIQVP